MALRPTLRESHRYIAYSCDAKHSFSAVKRAILATCQRCLGEFGMAKVHLSIIDNTYQDGKGILRCVTRHVDDVRAALTQLKEIGGKPARIRTLGVSGTIKKAKQWVI